MKFCIVVPAHNESRTIGYIVESLKAKQFDVILIDDGSKDKTGAIAKQKGAVVIRNEQKKGKGFSLKKGFQEALKKDYDGVIAMDADGQHDPEDLDQFLAVARKHTRSIVTGNRMQNAKGMPMLRYIVNRLMSAMISLVCRQRIPDTQCGYRYIGSDVLRELDLKSNDYEIETEILIKSSKKGIKIFSVPVKTIYSLEESKINPIKDGIRFIVYFLKEIFS